MSRYFRGDVILTAVRVGPYDEGKVRPAVVVHADEKGCLMVCPISCSPSWDQPSVPIDLEDFQDGGLDILDKSYALTGVIVRIPARDVAGKRGRLTREAMEAISPGSGSGEW